MANSPVVILVLLATGACAPFQLLMNECIAATESSGQVRAKKLQIGLLLFVQAIACAMTICCLPSQRFSLLQVAIVVVLLAINTGLSYIVSLRYYRMVMATIISKRFAVLMGVIPGATSLLLYLAYSLAASNEKTIAAAFIMASTILPSVILWLYIKSGNDNFRCTKTINGPHSSLSSIWLIVAAAILAALAAGSTLLRDSVAHLSVDYVALLLVSLNLFLSLINTLTRVAFLNNGGSDKKRVLATASLFMASSGAFAGGMGWQVSPLLYLIATQFAVACVIEAARRIPQFDSGQ